jgi:hypothetical protein
MLPKAMSSKKLAILAIVGLLLVGGAGFGYYTMKMNAENFRGIEVSVKGVEEDQVESWVSAFQAALKRDDVAQIIVEKSGYVEKLGIPEGEAVNHLKEAAVVKFSKQRKAIQIGLNGKRKQNAELDEISRTIFNVAAVAAAELEPDFADYYRKLSENR